MTSLSHLQNEFQDYLLGNTQAFQHSVTGPSKTFVKQRLAIYSEAYRLRLVDILKIDFPALYQWVGEKAFEKLGRSYLAHYPSRFFSARDFGCYMADFLAVTAPYSKNTFLAELAAFERTLSETIDTPNDTILTINDILAIPMERWAGMRLKLHSAVRIVPLSWNIPAIRHELITHNNKITRRQAKQTTAWLIWRQHINVKYKELDSKENFTINAFTQNKTFEDICTGLMEWLTEEETAPYIVQFLQQWIPEQIFSQVTLG